MGSRPGQQGGRGQEGWPGGAAARPDDGGTAESTAGWRWPPPPGLH